MPVGRGPEQARLQSGVPVANLTKPAGRLNVRNGKILQGTNTKLVTLWSRVFNPSATPIPSYLTFDLKERCADRIP